MWFRDLDAHNQPCPHEHSAAHSVLAEMENNSLKRDQRSFSMLILACVRANDKHGAFAALREMLRARVKVCYHCAGMGVVRRFLLMIMC